MRHKVEKFIDGHNLLEQGKKVLVALSGGADSVALLVVLQRLGYDCEAIHCNFHLRGKESNRDEHFVKELCQRSSIKLHTVHFDTTAYSKERRISIEMAAREQRYAAFEEYRAAIGAQAIAVAHHRDDSAETLLLNLVRGTGIKGLRGIQPRNGYIVRPLLCVGRDEIIDYLKWRGQEYITDSTNLTCDYTRNKIRLELIPKMAEINPSVLSTLAATAQRMSDAERIYSHAINEAAERVRQGNTISIEAIEKEIAPEAILHAILSPLGFNSAQIEDIAQSMGKEGSKQFHSTEWSVIKDRERLIITPRKNFEQESTTLPSNGKVKSTHGTLTIATMEFDGDIPKERNKASLDADMLHMPLTLRSTLPGDRFAPFGMRGTKLVSDYLTDRKKSLIERQSQLVVCDATGEIVWLVGERPSSRCCINEKTKNTVHLEWNNA